MAVSAMSTPISGLVAEYILNGNANDTSGNENNGTPNNVTWPYTNFGNQAQSVYFNGTSSFIDA
jgi:hypothetical protein